MSTKNSISPSKYLSGFSLIEVMIGMVLGLAAMLVILQMYSVFEGQKRTTTGGVDAQENGLFALSLLERDIKMAGYGLSNSATLACTTYFTSIDTGAGPGPIPGFSTAPITITDGGAGPDIVTMRQSASFNGGAPGTIQQTMPPTSAVFKVASTFGFQQDTLALVVQGGNCTVLEITNVNTPSSNLSHGPGGAAPSPADPRYNPAGGCYTSGPGPCTDRPTYTPGAQIFNLANLITRTYAVNAATNALVLTEGAAAAQPVAAQIIDMQAQYGITAGGAGNQTVTQWVDATGIWLAPIPADIRRIKAVRIAVMAQSTQFERTPVSPAAIPLWLGGPSRALTPAQQNFRYRVYQTIVPIRNVLWANI